jgi:SAM-dependent MidA family methyltransferase
VEERLREEIARRGALPFSRFQRIALYAPGCGYYRTRDPFGAAGDYYTAAQLTPAFGLMARALIEWTGEREVTEPGAGRGALREALPDFTYRAIEIGQRWPHRMQGVVFSNEWWDALPVDLAVFRDGRWRERRVIARDGLFLWTEGPLRAAWMQRYLEANFLAAEEGALAELPCGARRLLRRAAARLDRGFVISIDYGYVTGELYRYPHGTLMSYQKHQAGESVLDGPGTKDLTSHVNFSYLIGEGRSLGLETVRFGTLNALLFGADAMLSEARWAGFLASVPQADAGRARRQFGALITQFGDRFRVLIQEKKKGPNPSP